MQKILPVVVIIEIGVGTTVPIIFRGANLCMLVTFPQSAHFYLTFSGDGCTFFHYRKIGFKLTF